MNDNLVRAVLQEKISLFRSWSYADLAKAIDSTRRAHDCLAHFDGVVSDGTGWQIEINVFWDDLAGGDVRVIGDISADSAKPRFGVLYSPTLVDSFIMRPDGSFVDEG